MTRHPAIRIGAAAVVLCAAAAVAVAVATAGPAAAARPYDPARTAASVPVVVTCTGQAETSPSKYVLACADGNAYLARLRWASWGAAAAFASGKVTFLACVPSCVAGSWHSFSALLVLWRARPRPGHSGQQYFSRLTVIYTGTRSYRADGKTYHLRQSETYPLSPTSGP